MNACQYLLISEQYSPKSYFMLYPLISNTIVRFLYFILDHYCNTAKSEHGSVPISSD